MKNRTGLIVNALISVIMLLGACAATTLAQQGKTNGNQVARTGGKTPEDFASFWLRFKAAVLTADKEAVTSMTNLPFLFEGNELSKTRFIQEFDTIFDKRVKARLLKARAVKDGGYYEVFCGAEAVFLFKRIDGKYKFIEIGVND